MGPTAVSEVTEQIARIVFILVGSYLTLNVFGGTVLQAVLQRLQPMVQSQEYLHYGITGLKKKNIKNGRLRYSESKCFIRENV